MDNALVFLIPVVTYVVGYVMGGVHRKSTYNLYFEQGVEYGCKKVIARAVQMSEEHLKKEQEQQQQQKKEIDHDED